MLWRDPFPPDQRSGFFCGNRDRAGPIARALSKAIMG
jgi:hypothetical protein